MHGIRQCLGWLLHRPAYMMLTASDMAMLAEPPARFARAGGELMLLAVLWGILLSVVWTVSWGLFQDYTLLIMPAAATLAVHVLWPMRRMGSSLAEVVGRGNGLAEALLVAVLALCLLSLQADYNRAENSLPEWLAWIRPSGKMLRVLLLMPVWGTWAMLIMPQFCRAGDCTEPWLAAFAKGCGPMAAAAMLPLPLAGTIFYFHYMGPNAQLWISGLSLLSAIGGSLLLCRVCGGLNRRSWLAVGALTQMVFLVTYLGHLRVP